MCARHPSSHHHGDDDGDDDGDNDGEDDFGDADSDMTMHLIAYSFIELRKLINDDDDTQYDSIKEANTGKDVSPADSTVAQLVIVGLKTFFSLNHDCCNVSHHNYNHNHNHNHNHDHDHQQLPSY